MPDCAQFDDLVGLAAVNMIRIIAGTHRGRIVRTPKHIQIRPILARIRKSLFDILAPRIRDSVFLDLYCGTGAVGIEALSRGARLAVFADISRESLAIAARNLDSLGLSEKSRTVRCDATGKLEFLKITAGAPFDIIFLGPPYKDEGKKPLAMVIPTLEAAHSSGILAPRGIIVAQHHKKEDAVPPPFFRLSRREAYGDSMLSFYENTAEL